MLNGIKNQYLVLVEARLEKGEKKMAYQDLKYDSWNVLKSEVFNDLYHEPILPEKRFVFRGQRNPDWTLISSFDRMFGSLDFSKRKSIQCSLNEYFKDYCREIKGMKLFKDYSDTEVLTLGQHYGLPTRLLDWSYSIYIAAFFAFSNNGNDNSNQVSIWVIDTEHEVWKAQYGVKIVTSRIDENLYQKNQKGLFTLNESPELTLEEYVESCKKRCNVDGALSRITIPIEERKVVLNDLEMMGINHMHLFPDYEGCANSALLKTFVTHNIG